MAERRVQVRCWVGDTGKKPVKDWISSLDDAAFKKIDKMIGLLRELGRDLTLPHARFLGDDLWELRDRSTGPGFRIYYTWEGDTLVILLALELKVRRNGILRQQKNDFGRFLMAIKKKDLERFDDYDDIRKERLSKAELKKQDKLIKAEAQALKFMQEAVSRAVAAYMAEEEIGINELTRRLDTSSRQTSRIMKGEANLTLATIAHLASLMNKTPKILFD